MTIKQSVSRLKVFPLTTEANEKDHLVIGGCDCVTLAEEFGTPLYVFDEADLRGQCAAFKQEFVLYDRIPPAICRDNRMLFRQRLFHQCHVTAG